MTTGRSQLHTIISREIIKPSSPTPSHLQTYNLSPVDQVARHTYMPMILFYPNNGLSAHDKAEVMKKSLSEILTRYYPMAGRLHTPKTPYVYCNDEGVIFGEASLDSQLKTFIQHINAEYNVTLDHLFADGVVWSNSPRSTHIVGVQLNHFTCGGMAVAVSMSHVIGDFCTLGSFFDYWGLVTRYGSTDHKELLPMHPHFIRSQLGTNSIPPADVDPVYNQAIGKTVIGKFVFPNTKLSDLKNKVNTLGQAGSTPYINNPTRVEVLTSLLYKTAVAAATKKSGCFKLSCMTIPVDIRSRLIQKLPKTTVGNILSKIMIRSRHTTETSLNVVVAEIRNQKSQLECIQSVQHAAENYKTMQLKLMNGDLEDLAHRTYACSSLCGSLYDKVDFGWGKSMDSYLPIGSVSGFVGFLLKDTPDGDGIEALVILEEEDMEIFQNDKEILSFCYINEI